MTKKLLLALAIIAPLVACDSTPTAISLDASTEVRQKTVEQHIAQAAWAGKAHHALMAEVIDSLKMLTSQHRSHEEIAAALDAVCIRHLSKVHQDKPSGCGIREKLSKGNRDNFMAHASSLRITDDVPPALQNYLDAMIDLANAADTYLEFKYPLYDLYPSAINDLTEAEAESFFTAASIALDSFDQWENTNWVDIGIDSDTMDASPYVVEPLGIASPSGGSFVLRGSHVALLTQSGGFPHGKVAAADVGGAISGAIAGWLFPPAAPVTVPIMALAGAGIASVVEIGAIFYRAAQCRCTTNN